MGVAAALPNPSGTRHDYVLMAHIIGDNWMCHNGAEANVELAEEDPINPCEMVHMGVWRDACGPATAPRKRVGPHTSAGKLRRATTRTPRSCSTAVDNAMRKAEEM